MNDWEAELLQALEDYKDEITDGVKNSVEEVAEKTVETLKRTSPKRATGKKKGKYARGWRAKDVTWKATEREVVVHNATDYQLTHLLEKGHVNRDGSFTAARPHIAAAETQAAKDLEEKITVIIKG